MTIDYQAVYGEERDFLWGYCYRLTGSAADAEDLVQDAFVRALESPPADTDRPWRPWLLRVATNLARDASRRAIRQRYIGPWLPSPVDTGEGSLFSSTRGTTVDVAGRYEWLESVSIAFLLALEALSPRQRAVLLLRDVYDYSVLETTEALELSAANVKTILHRARQALADYDHERRPPGPDRIRLAGEVLTRLLQRLEARDTQGIEALLSEGVQSLSDGNGHFHAARVPVLGRQRVALLYTKIQPTDDEPLHVQIRQLNGFPTVVGERPQAPQELASRFTLAIDVDQAGVITHLYTVVAPDKLTALRFSQ